MAESRPIHPTPDAKVTSFPDTPQGHADLGRYVLQTFGPDSEYRGCFGGIALRTKAPDTAPPASA